MIIHLLAPKNKTQWSDIWHHCYNIWKSSPYEIKMWHDEDVDNLIKEDNKDFFDIIDTLPSIYKWDYVRYIILEKFSGAYFDMDVEILKDFFPILNPNKVYIMEGIGGTLVENSIMIDSLSPSPKFWNRFKMFTQRKIMENLNKCQDPYNVLHYAGPWMMTELLSKHQQWKKDHHYSLLGFEQFANPNNEISFSKHYQTSYWIK